MAVLFGGGFALRLGTALTTVLAASFLLFAYVPLAARLQDRLLEFYLSSGRFRRALAIAAAVRDSARTPLGRALAEFDLGLVHLARGAPADAVRCFSRLERHRLKDRTRLLADLHLALAKLRSLPSDAEAAERTQAGTALATLADAVAAELGQEALPLALAGEGRLAAGEGEAAFDLLERSLQRDGDPCDPSPGERHLVYARAALATGRREAAEKALRIAAGLPRGPFAKTAREELKRLVPHG